MQVEASCQLAFSSHLQKILKDGIHKEIHLKKNNSVLLLKTKGFCARTNVETLKPEAPTVTSVFHTIHMLGPW